MIKEYREGLLLFNLMQDKIWTVRDSDSTKLKMFFDDNKNNYSSTNIKKDETFKYKEDFLNNYLKFLSKFHFFLILNI